MFIENLPFLHLLVTETHFCAAAFVRTQSTADIWKCIQAIWCDTYLGPPDFLSVDQGSAFVSKEMSTSLAAHGVTLLEAPGETPGAIDTVERYHGTLRIAYRRIREDLDRSTTDVECLRMDVFSVNATLGPKGLCPMLLVFGALPRPARSIEAPTQVRRAQVMELAAKDFQREQGRRRISFGLRHTVSPKGAEDVSKLSSLPSGAQVLIYRQKSKSWEGPCRFIEVDGETVVVQHRKV